MIGNQLKLTANSVSRLLSNETRKFGGVRAIRSTYNAESARLCRYLGATWREVGDYFGISPGSAWSRAQFANSEGIPIIVELNIRLVEPVDIIDGSIPVGDYVLSYGARDTVVLAGAGGVFQTEVDELVGRVELRLDENGVKE
jgi:hypothetical protein